MENEQNYSSRVAIAKIKDAYAITERDLYTIMKHGGCLTSRTLIHSALVPPTHVSYRPAGIATDRMLRALIDGIYVHHKKPVPQRTYHSLCHEVVHKLKALSDIDVDTYNEFVKLGNKVHRYPQIDPQEINEQSTHCFLEGLRIHMMNKPLRKKQRSRILSKINEHYQKRHGENVSAERD
jgi:hypothetical protein